MGLGGLGRGGGGSVGLNFWGFGGGWFTNLGESIVCKHPHALHKACATSDAYHTYRAAQPQSLSLVLILGLWLRV